MLTWYILAKFNHHSVHHGQNYVHVHNYTCSVDRWTPFAPVVMVLCGTSTLYSFVWSWKGYSFFWSLNFLTSFEFSYSTTKLIIINLHVISPCGDLTF